MSIVLYVLLSRRQEAILQKSVQLEVPLLDDKSMLERLISCQKNIQRNKMILEETHYLREHLEDKRIHYVPVATHGAKLYEIVQRVSVLNPLYHITFETYRKLFETTLQARHRGKGVSGMQYSKREILV